MSGSIWNKWRVIITATQAEAFVLRTETQGAPAVGPAGEPIDTAKSRIIDHRDDGEVKIKEMGTETGTFYQFKHQKFVAPANQVSTHTMSFDVPINIVSAMVQFTSEMEGDIVTWTVAPNTTAGILTVAASISDTVLDVAQTVIDNADLLFRIRLADPGDPTNVYEDVGYACNFDEENTQITVSTALTQAWPIGTLVQITNVYVDDVELGSLDWVVAIGADKIGSSYLPANTPVVCTYDNKHATNAKTLYSYFSYLYGRVKPE